LLAPATPAATPLLTEKLLMLKMWVSMGDLICISRRSQTSHLTFTEI